MGTFQNSGFLKTMRAYTRFLEDSVTVAVVHDDICFADFSGGQDDAGES